LRDLKDLEAELNSYQAAAELTPEVSYHQVIGVAFGSQYKRFGHLKGLEASLQNFEQAAELRTQCRPARIGQDFGHWLGTRSVREIEGDV
jgi:hypothetical protein